MEDEKNMPDSRNNNTRSDIPPEGTANLVRLIKPIHDARNDRSRADSVDRAIATVLKAHLRTLPEGEREMWDMEANPPIGVGLEDGNTPRWVDTSELDDETIVWAVRQGLIRGLNGDLFDSMKAITEIETIRKIAALTKAVHQGVNEQLVMLPKRRGRRE